MKKVIILYEDYRDYDTVEEIAVAEKLLDGDYIELTGIRPSNLGNEHEKYRGTYCAYTEIQVNGKDYYMPVYTIRGKVFLVSNNKVWDFIPQKEYEVALDYIEGHLDIDVNKKTATFATKPGRGKSVIYHTAFDDDGRKYLVDKNGRVVKKY